MKKTVVLFILVVVLAACGNKHGYKAIKSQLDLAQPMQLETIEKARQAIAETTNLTPEQVTDLQVALSDYIMSCAEQEAEHFTTEYSNVYKTENDNVENARKIDSLNNEMLLLKRYGIQMYRSEGSIESAVSPLFVLEPFWSYLSKSEQEFAISQQIEFDQPPLEDAGLIISYQEVSDRLAKYDVLCKEFATDSLYPAFEAMQTFYLSLLMVGVDNSPAFDWETNTLNPELKEALFNYIAEHPYALSTSTLRQFVDILKKNKYQKSNLSDIFVTNTLKLNQ